MVEGITTVCPSAMSVIVVHRIFPDRVLGGAATLTWLNAAPAPICPRTGSAQTVVSDCWFAGQHTVVLSQHRRRGPMNSPNSGRKRSRSEEDGFEAPAVADGRLRSSGSMRTPRRPADRTLPGRAPDPGSPATITVVRHPDPCQGTAHNTQNGRTHIIVGAARVHRALRDPPRSTPWASTATSATPGSPGSDDPQADRRGLAPGHLINVDRGVQRAPVLRTGPGEGPRVGWCSPRRPWATTRNLGRWTALPARPASSAWSGAWDWPGPAPP
jgi:hypothetical protein